MDRLRQAWAFIVGLGFEEVVEVLDRGRALIDAGSSRDAKSFMAPL